MITFPILNSLKFTTRNTTSLDNYRNRLYENYVGVNQRRVYTKSVPCVIFNAYDNIIIQATFSDGIDGVGLNRIGDTAEYYGKLTAPTGGVTATNVIDDIWNITIPVDFEGFHSFSIIDEYDDETYYSEQIYGSSEFFSSEFDPHLLDIQYKNANGLENGYYWSGTYQRIKIEDAYKTDTDIDVEQESAENLKKETETLGASSIEWVEYTLSNIPEYLAKKIVKAAIQTDVIVRGVESVYKAHSFGEKRDGRIDFTISFKNAKQINTY